MATLILLTVVNILNYLDRNLVQAVRPIIDAEWQLSQVESGVLVSAFVIGYALFSPIAGALSARRHQPTLLALGLVIWSAGTCATGIAPSQPLFLLSRIVVGIGESLFITVAAIYLKEVLSCPIRITRGFSLFYAAIPVGSALGYVVGGLVARWFSWQTAFFVGGVPGFLLAPLVWRLPSVDRRVNGADDDDNRSTGQVGDESEAPHGWGAYRQSVRGVVGSRAAIGIIAGYVANTFALAGLAANVTAHGMQLGYSIDEIGTRFGAALVVSGFIGTLGGGWIFSQVARRAESRNRSLILSCAISAGIACPFLMCAFETSSPSLFMALCFLAELFIFAGTAPINALLVTAVPSHLVGATQGISIASINIFGSFLAPILVGVVADRFSLRWGLHLCSGALALSGIIWFRTRNSLRGHAEQGGA